MKKPSHLYLLLGIAMVIALVAVAFVPIPDAALPAGYWNIRYVAHFLVFATLGSVWMLALPRASSIALALGLIVFGLMHEALEIIGHSHPLEMKDVIVNALGVIVAVCCLRAVRYRRALAHSSSLPGSRS